MKQQFPSLDVVFTLIKERIDAQLAQVDAMDAKVNFILGSATAVISAGLVVQGLSPSSHCSLLTNKFLQSLPAISLFASYLATTLPAFFAYRLHAFRGGALPKTLFDEYLPKEEDTTKAEVSKSMVVAYEHNGNLIKRKAFWAQFALVTLLVEVIVLTSMILLQTVC